MLLQMNYCMLKNELFYSYKTQAPVKEQQDLLKLLLRMVKLNLCFNLRRKTERKPALKDKHAKLPF